MMSERADYADGGFTWLHRDSTPPDEPAPVEVVEPEPELLSDRSNPERDPAREGRRGTWNRMLGRWGRIRPTKPEVESRIAAEYLQTQWDRPRMVMVANPKGGQCKTPGAWLLGALFGQARGAGVCVWDNAECGSLAMRATAASAQSTVWDLLANADRLAVASSVDVGGFLRRQPTREHILAGDDSPVHTARIGRAECETVRNVLARHYDLLVADTGNDYLSDRWLWTAEYADALVIPMQYWEVSAKLVAPMLDRLRSMGLDHLVDSAVVAVSHLPGGGDAVTVARVRKLLERKGVTNLVEVPYEVAFASSGRLRVDGLSPVTVRAWTRVAAEAAIALDAAPVREVAPDPLPVPQRRVAKVSGDRPPWVDLCPPPILVRTNGSEVHR